MPLPLFALIDRWRVPAPDAAKVAWVRNTTYAHRGLHGDGVPENSPSAFAAAIERGLGIECDVQRTSDGQGVIFHDWDLDRMTVGAGQVAKRPVSDLAAMRLKGSDECIPTLPAFLDLVAGRVPLLIEIKSRKDMRIVPLCLAVRRALEGYRGPHAIISFDPRIARWFRRHSPGTLTGLSFTDKNDRALSGAFRRRLAFWHARAHFITYDIGDLPNGFAKAQRKRGVPLVTWTVKSREQRERAIELADAYIAEGQGLA